MLSTTKLFSILTIAIGLMLSANVAFAQEEGQQQQQQQPAEMSISDLVEQTEQLSTLRDALSETGLDEELAEGGPYTVLVPTDDAFDQLSDGEREEIMNDTEELKSVLEYHIIEGEVPSQELSQNETLETKGGEVEVNTSASSVQVDDANVVQFDVQASDGIVHVVDTVVNP